MYENQNSIEGKTKQTQQKATPILTKIPFPRNTQMATGKHTKMPEKKAEAPFLSPRVVTISKHATAKIVLFERK